MGVERGRGHLAAQGYPAAAGLDARRAEELQAALALHEVLDDVVELGGFGRVPRVCGLLVHNDIRVAVGVHQVAVLATIQIALRVDSFAVAST